MVDVMISAESGKIHAVYHKSAAVAAPLAVILPGNPHAGYHMNDRVAYAMFRAYMDIGFSVLRFDYRGVGDSEGVIGTPSENVIDIAAVIDWIQNQNEDSDRLWLAGNHQGAWYVLQTMMRRPEVSGFTLVSPDISVSDFTFLSPRPNRGLIIQGAREDENAHLFATHLSQILKKQAQISTEILKIKDATEKYASPPELKQLYNDIKAYVGRENAEDKLL
ncbi:MAG: alpha/beta fold hydrolase [Rickettsiales bacterium]|jgi:alpha/beta superfamily hydrolase|nr:alpha/beta fold hydrolase [Rickettsiales bacterium]